MDESSDDDVQDAEPTTPVPDCEGLPRRLWISKCVQLYNADGKLVGEGTCHCVKSNLVIGANGPLGDTHVAVHVCRTHSVEDISDDVVYALVAWPIKLVHYHGASPHDHEARDNFNRLQGARANPTASGPKRSYTSAARNPPPDIHLRNIGSS